MQSIFKVLLDATYDQHLESLRAQRRCHAYKNHSRLENIIVNSRSIHKLIVVLSYVDKIVKNKSGNEHAILGAYSTEFESFGNMGLLRREHSNRELRKVYRGCFDLIAGSARASKASETCQHNARILLDGIANKTLNQVPLCNVFIGVCAPTPQNLEQFHSFQISIGLKWFVERYFDKHPDEFPLGNWRELTLMSTL